VFFGVWADSDAALKRYQAEAHNLHNGHKPTRRDRLTIAELVNKFLTSKKRLHDACEIASRTWTDYFDTCELLVELLGGEKVVEDLGPGDFERLREKMADRWGPVRLGNVMQRVRSVFKYAADYRLVDKPVHFGRSFDRPSKKTLRIARAKRGPRMFEAGDLRALLDRASQPLRTMILLGTNCGFGNTDVATLPETAVDLDGGWINFPRPKTGVNRRCPLWPETIAGLREVLSTRPRAKAASDAGLVFLTAFGSRFVTVTTDKVPAHEQNGNGVHKALRVCWGDALTKEFRKAASALGVQKNGVSFYALRHTFQTVADESRDRVAVSSIMGHTDNSMAGVYRERISDERLQAVTAHVRAWLFGSPAQEQPPADVFLSNGRIEP
jgi:integrase